ncbi:hypothetical protein C1G86_1627 [Dehalococcoides mccartyi]|uniref:Uncharacterized protein n=1 Tax=Dehalococcoides mccartyi TaxID=61435 RepID=A0A328EMW5_9CHLR|nr:hypothetical protein C1G87_0010 [Dehalococcoides mccartyi]RAL69982.1 hypothetical protein C1G86_1627 [Dehalococcoides mccartyi]
MKDNFNFIHFETKIVVCMKIPVPELLRFGHCNSFYRRVFISVSSRISGFIKSPCG